MATPENQAKINWLNRYRSLDMEINRKCEELSRWRSRAEKITPTISKAPGGSGNGDRITDAVEKIVSIEEEINTDVDRLISVRGEVEKAIKSVPDETLRTLLELRYIDGLTWEKIAVKMNYGFQWVCKLHGRALTQVHMQEAIESDTPSVV